MLKIKGAATLKRKFLNQWKTLGGQGVSRTNILCLETIMVNSFLNRNTSLTLNVWQSIRQFLSCFIKQIFMFGIFICGIVILFSFAVSSCQVNTNLDTLGVVIRHPWSKNRREHLRIFMLRRSN